METVIEINRTLVADTGEHHFVRDSGLLESALARPQNAFAYGEEDLVVLAVARSDGGGGSRSCVEQGNKRTAFAAMRLFLRANGYDTIFDDTVDWTDEMVKLLERRLSEKDFVAALRPYVVER